MTDPAPLQTRRLPPSRLVGEACREIVAAHPDRVPDLTSVVIVTPNLHCRHHVARHLQRAATGSVLLLPRIATFRSWADEIELTHTVRSALAREAALHHALSTRRWFDHADLWALVAELSSLFDELTRWHVGMPRSVADFQQRLEAAYRARAGASFAFEARLVCELWHVFAGETEPLDAEAAYQLRLGRLGDPAVEAIYCIGIGVERLAPAEQGFLRRWSERVPVTCFEPLLEQGGDLGPVEQVLADAWPRKLAQPMAQRAASLCAAHSESPLAGRLEFCAVRGIEQEARAIDIAVRRWLHAGRSRIAVVVLDRLTARRARALLERAQVLVRDEVGWAFSTTSASTAISRWLDLCGNDFYHRDLLDFLKSPFALHDWERTRRQAAVWRLESAIRKQNVRTGLDRYEALAKASGDADVVALLLAVRAAARQFDGRRRRSLCEWLTALKAALAEVGVAAGFAADAAGEQLLALLANAAAELRGHEVAVTLGEFRRWLGRRLETAMFRDTQIDSPVVFCSLSGMRLREFDAVLVCGADAVNLSGAPAPGLFFNQSVRRELGLPGHAEAMGELESDLFHLVANTPEVCVTWQQVRGGDPNLLASPFDRLLVLHRLAWGHALTAEALQAAARTAACVSEAGAGTAPLRGVTVPPVPVVSADALPASISASAYNALMACPYQFYARHVLKLRELDDVQEEIEKADFGTYVHEVLRRFHRACPVVSEVTADAAAAQLCRISQDVFSEATSADYLARAWLLRWEKLVPAYLDWQREREAAGWRFQAAEVDRSVDITTPRGRHFRVVGRIDRVDAGQTGAVSVIDYKTQASNALRRRLERPGEDVQLPVYGLLWEAPVSEAMFLALDRDEIRPVALPRDDESIFDEVRDRLGRMLDSICDGAPLPAHGNESACTYCLAQGLCRRKHWS
jgi:ATP-dependent helicase/nuclease subunit B